MVIQTTRFGKIQLQQDEVIQFPEGILGFADLRDFVLLDDPSDDIFAWLQSCTEPSVAFPVLEPELFTEKYSPALAKNDSEAIGLQAMSDVRMFCIVTIPDDPTQMTANLKAPIVINLKNKKARQCVLQENTLAIREPIFAKLQQRVVANPDLSIKSQAQSLGKVAIKISPNRSAEL